MRQVLLLLVAAAHLPFVSSFAAAHPTGFEEHRFNGRFNPVTEGGVTTFRLQHGQCSDVDFGDGRGETDCKKGNVRSILAHSPNGRMGQTLEYRFDLQIDPSFSYPGRWSSEAFAMHIDGGWDSHLRIASWEGEALHNYIYLLKVDARQGVSFLGEQCQSPEQFGEWITFSMKVRWSADEKGWVKVTCGDRIIYADENVATNQAPHCWEFTNQCSSGFKDPKRIIYNLGPVMMGNGSDNPPFFTPIQEGGIVIQMRNMAVLQEATLYDAEDVQVIRALQSALNALGCDVGAADGIVGRKTREAALACRAFPDEERPEKLTVATARKFLELYTSEDAATLPGGKLDGPAEDSDGLVAATHVLRFQSLGVEGAPRDPRVVAHFSATVATPGVGFDKLDFLLIGDYDFSLESFSEFGLLMEKDAGAGSLKALEACTGIRVEAWGDGTVHPVFNFERRGDSFITTGGPCGMAALPAKLAEEANFLLTQFSDVAVAVVKDGTIDGLGHEGLKDFLRRVARGEIKVSDNRS